MLNIYICTQVGYIRLPYESSLSEELYLPVSAYNLCTLEAAVLSGMPYNFGECLLGLSDLGREMLMTM